MIRYKPFPPPKKKLPMFTQLQEKDYELSLLPPLHKLKSDPIQSKVKTKVFSKLNTLDLSLVIICFGFRILSSDS